MNNFIKFFINQSKVINLLVLAITAGGLVVFIGGQKEGFPNISLDSVIIQTIYPGASPKEIEKLITDKLEEAIDSVEGSERIISRSTEGLSSIAFEVDPDYSKDINKVVNDIKRNVDSVNDLPEDAEDPVVTELNSDIFPVISVVISGEVDIKKLQNLSDVIEDDLKGIRGVSKIEKNGYREKEIWVEVNPAVIKSKDIDLNDVMTAVRLRNINMPGGKFDLKDKEYLIRSLGQYQNLEQIKNTVVRANDSGSTVYVKDIANVEWKHEKVDALTRVKGNNCIYIRVFKKKSGDIIKVADQVKLIIDEYNNDKSLDEEINLFYSDDFSYFVKNRLGVLSSNAFFGGFLVFLVLIVFFDWRTTFWTTLGIPIAFCAAMLTANALGMTLNLMSMFGFIIVIGMVVDDAIIVGENIYRHREEGKPMIKAAVDGASEVMLPVTATVATTVAAFLPMLLISGIMGKFLAFIPKVVAITMVASFVESLFVLPGHLAHIKKRTNEQKNQKTAKPPVKRRFDTFQQVFGKLVAYILDRPKRALFIFIIYSALAFTFFILYCPKIFFPGNVSEFWVRVETPIHNNLEKTSKAIDDLERKLRETMGEHTREFISTVGYWDSQNGYRYRTYIGSVRIILNPERSIIDDELFKIIQENSQNINGILKATVVKQQGGPPRDKPINIKIFGQSLDDLYSASKDVFTMVNGLSNTTSIDSSYEEGKDEYVLKINEEKAAFLKVNANGTALAVKNAFDGGVATVANTMAEEKEDVDIIVKYNEIKSKTQRDLFNVEVKNAQGQLIPVAHFAKFKEQKSIGLIAHEDGERYVSITGEIKNSTDRKHTPTWLNAQIEEKIPAIQEKHPNTRMVISGESEENAELTKSASIAGSLVVVLVVVILTSLFKSFVQPIIVMCAIPFGLVGVINGLILHYFASFIIPMNISMFAFSFMTVMGIVALVGVVVNDSLVLVSFVNKNRRMGLNKKEALIEASKYRLRPIILTTLTTLVGLIPFSYGIMGKEPFLQPMGIALIWGLVFATMVTLIILPVIYLLIDNLMETVYGWFGEKYDLPSSIE